MAASDNTFNESMQKVLQQIAIAATLPDADLQFCAALQAAITQKLREGSAVQQQAQQLQAGPPQGMQGGIAPSAAGGPMMGLTPSAPNMDEIRRMVGAGQAT